MHSTRSVLYRMLFLVAITMSLLFGISACGSSASNTPLTVLSISGGNVLIQKTGSSTWITGKAGMSLEAGEKIKNRYRRYGSCHLLRWQCYRIE